MSEVLLAILSGVRTVDDMVVAFSDEGRCRRLLESMVWPAGRICPACGYRHSIDLAGRCNRELERCDLGKLPARRRKERSRRRVGHRPIGQLFCHPGIQSTLSVVSMGLERGAS